MYKKIRFNILHNSKNVNFDVDPFYLLQIKKKVWFWSTSKVRFAVNLEI